MRMEARWQAMNGKGWIIVCGGRGETQFGSSDSRIDQSSAGCRTLTYAQNIERTWHG